MTVSGDDINQIREFAKLRGLDPEMLIRRYLKWEQKRSDYEELQDVVQPETKQRNLTLSWIIEPNSPFTFHQRYLLFLVDSLGSARRAAAYLGVNRVRLTDTLREMIPRLGGRSDSQD